AETEKSEIWSRPRSEHRPERHVSPGGGLDRRALALDAMDPPGRKARRPEPGLAHHPVVAVGMVRRHAALVAEEDLDPGEAVGLGRVGHELVSPAGRPAT